MGDVNSQICKGKYKAKLEIPGERGDKASTHPCGSYGHFLEPHNTCMIFNRFYDAGLLSNRQTT